MPTNGTHPPNAPQLPRETALEIDMFEAEVQRFARGEISPERFRSYRLSHGIYGQRQPGVQMIRVKIPAGDLSGAQMRRLSEIAAEFTPEGRLHLTTRQDVQYHFVPMERVPAVMRLLADVGLTTREACGNSVRNVTACPVTGFIADELFDVTPYTFATWSYLVRNPFCQQLARKFKISFSSCPEDCASAGIHDIGFVGRIQGENGTARLGFMVVVGGGLGSTPFPAKTLSEFVPLGEILPTIRGILEVFSSYGNRRNKMKARLKFVVAKQGIEEFRRKVDAAVAALAPNEASEAQLDLYVPEAYRSLVARHVAGHADSVASGRNVAGPSRETAEGRESVRATRAGATQTIVGLLGNGPGKADTAPAGPPTNGRGREAAADVAFSRWAERNVRAHKDPSRAVVTVTWPLGDLEAPRMTRLADLVRDHANDRARVAIDQNLALPDVPKTGLRALYDGLAGIGLAEGTARTALDITSCPGADTCALGITSSKGLARAIREELLTIAGTSGLEPFDGVSIKISGCPNSCGQHHVANLGFHGVARKVGNHYVPAYQLHLGGRITNGEARIGTALDKIPAKKVPSAVAALLVLWRLGRSEGESFADFVVRAPRQTIADSLRPFTSIDADDVALATDWGQEGAFTTDEIGAGECAGAGTDVAVKPFDNFEAELLQVALFVEREQWADAIATLNRSQYTLARILLEKLGKNPESDYETTCELRALVIDRGLASEAWNEWHAAIDLALETRHPRPEQIDHLVGLARTLLQESNTVLPVLVRKGAEKSQELPG